MTDSVETRIKLPGEVHRMVKAEAARHGVKVAEALGMCVAFLCTMTTPLAWRIDKDLVVSDVDSWLVLYSKKE